MKWNKYTLKTTTEAIDYISGLMIELGIDGIQIEDNVPLSEEDKKAMFIDYLPTLPKDDGTAYISFYTEEDNDDEALLHKVREKLKEASSFINVGEGTIEKDITEDIDWVNNWKQFFKAFGTGKHETTQLCINQLIKYVKPGDTVLDLGCGSGILSIVAKKLEAGKMAMTDIDPAAITASKENFQVNHIAMDDIDLYDGNIIDDEELQKKVGFNKYDVVVANILADVIIPISAIVDKFLRKGGIFISSGIIYMKEEDVVDAIKKNHKLKFMETVNQGDWRAIMAQKISD